MKGSKYDSYPAIGVFYFRLLISLDQLVNVLLLGFPDETVSGRIGRAILSGNAKGWVIPFRRIVDGIFLVLAGERNHCIESVEHEDGFDERRELWCWSVKNEPDATGDSL